MIVGIISDLHLPFEHPNYLDFCKRIFKKYRVNKIVQIGDFTDNHSISFHEHNPDGQASKDEIELVIKKAKEWYKAFPRVTVIKGNHDILPERRLLFSGISKLWLRQNKDVFELPNGWNMVNSVIVDGVVYEHGIGYTGKTGALDKAKFERMSCVIGHSHGCAGLFFHSNKVDTIFGMNVGCGIDSKSYAFRYNEISKNQPILACGVVKNGKQPILERML